ncbi:hypothetical protein NDU88_010230 [Pleurodeles waltl]|uniref:Uncharacterized protein n=1 Tax=Pleurodeles waltl TaxID=8319 RepID=A0AAV7S0N5_PLEWA|nr:hypothetical protein NDU88_010230 [Pleurodeles waltl]
MGVDGAYVLRNHLKKRPISNPRFLGHFFSVGPKGSISHIVVSGPPEAVFLLNTFAIDGISMKHSNRAVYAQKRSLLSRRLSLYKRAAENIKANRGQRMEQERR